MIEIIHTSPVARPADHAFDVMVRHQEENHPRWEPEVLEVRPLDERVGVGHRSVMVRREFGRTRDVVNECVEYVDGRRAAYSNSNPVMDFWIAFDFADQGPAASTLTSTVRMTPKGVWRAFSPLLRMGGPRRSARISGRAVRVIEAAPARDQGARQA